MSILTLGCDGRAVMNVDNILDLSVPIMTVATRKNNFGPVQIEDLLSKVMTIRNVGQVPLHWFIEDSEKVQSTVPWLHFSPFDGALAVKQESKICVMLDCRLLHADLLRRTAAEGKAADSVKFEDTVVLRVKGGEEFKCVISGRLKMEINRGRETDTAERFEYESTRTSSISSAIDEPYQCDGETGSEVRPSERMVASALSRQRDMHSPSMLSYLFTMVSDWVKPNRASPINARDAIAAANVAGFL